MTETLRIHGRVLPGGEERDLFVTGESMSFDAAGDVRTIAEDGWIIPGLADCHAHLAMAAPGGSTSEERVRASAAAHLDAGVLLIREPGGPDDASAAIGPGEGLPTVLTAGQFLSAPGGYMPGLAREVSGAELAGAAAETAASGRPWVKLITDWAGPSGVAAKFTGADIAAAVQAAQAGGARVAVHATIDATIRECLEAGVDSIEHGTFVSQETLELWGSTSKAAWVPTLLANDTIPAIVRQTGAPPAMVESIAKGIERMPVAIRAGHDLGIRILAGTDAGLGPHGKAAEEIWRLHFAGLDAEAALGAGSWLAREYLGLPGIEDGAPADLVVYDRDPREDLGRLRDPRVVILHGRVIRGG